MIHPVLHADSLCRYFHLGQNPYQETVSLALPADAQVLLQFSSVLRLFFRAFERQEDVSSEVEALVPQISDLLVWD